MHRKFNLASVNQPLGLSPMKTFIIALISSTLVAAAASAGESGRGGHLTPDIHFVTASAGSEKIVTSRWTNLFEAAHESNDAHSVTNVTPNGQTMQQDRKKVQGVAGVGGRPDTICRCEAGAYD